MLLALPLRLLAATGRSRRGPYRGALALVRRADATRWWRGVAHERRIRWIRPPASAAAAVRPLAVGASAGSALGSGRLGSRCSRGRAGSSWCVAPPLRQPSAAPSRAGAAGSLGDAFGASIGRGPRVPRHGGAPGSRTSTPVMRMCSAVNGSIASWRARLSATFSER